MSTRSLLILIATTVASAAAAAPTIDPQFGDHAVIQRDRPVIFSGDATAGQQVTVDFGGAQQSATADRAGRWSATFPAHPAGGPFTIQVSAPDGTASAQDV